MQLLVEGISHRAAPLEFRERVFLSGDRLGDALATLAALPSVSGGAILSTCNRTEFYVTGADARDASTEILGVIGDPQGAVDWERYRYRLGGAQAISHMFRVAAGIDSAILGEGQILAQFKSAHGEARRAAVIDGTLDYLMRRAITTAKRVKTETGISRGSVGFGQAAVVRARQVLGELEGRTALLVGAGEMGGSTARLLASAGVTDFLLAARTRGRAEALAATVPAGAAARVVAFSEIAEAAVSADLVV